ncbi:hypothetical protein A2335_02265 [Candidatus Peregrinibacteria bacterium RIFOXYB2_FULL_32_7]|nr:MAG: hypothetical protein A2335_02265 [Candidatus Peregrinibacteria bacterium RIFOXYB2_FULL_32_7]
MSFKKIKSWPKGWYFNPKNFLKKEESFFAKFFHLNGLFLILILILLLVFLSFQFFGKIERFKLDLSALNIVDFEKVWGEFGEDLNILAEDRILFKDESLKKSLAILNQEYEKILDITGDMKILPSQFLINFSQKKSLTEVLKIAGGNISQINESFTQINNIFEKHQKIFESYPEFLKYEQYFNEAIFLSKNLETHLLAILDLLGDRYPRKYIVLLQNSSEIRPTGGFIGGFITFDMNDGYLENLEYFDVYTHDGQLPDISKEEIPEEIKFVAGSQWGLRDANISPDFSISAKYVQKLLEASKADSVDPVIAIDLSVAKEFLSLIDNLYLQDFDLNLNEENFETILTYIVESKLTGENSPKEIFKNLIPEFLKSLKNSKVSLYDLSILISKLVEEKHIQGYSNNLEIQNFFKDYGIAGEISIKADEDYLQIVEISIGGNKTDRWIEEKISHNTLISGDGKILNELKILRENSMNLEKLNQQKVILKSVGFENIDPIVENILFTGTNKNRFRIYVPLGAKLEFAKGVDSETVETKIDDDLHLTYFAFETELAMGKSQEIFVVYSLPFDLNLKKGDEYRLKIVKQAGKEPIIFAKEFLFETGVKVYSFYPVEFEKEDDGMFLMKGILKGEINVGAVVGIE